MSTDTKEHKHSFKEGNDDNYLEECSCGAILCAVQGPHGILCNLERGHKGPHKNTWIEMGETW
jgi:hypothetical protein